MEDRKFVWLLSGESPLEVLIASKRKMQASLMDLEVTGEWPARPEPDVLWPLVVYGMSC